MSAVDEHGELDHARPSEIEQRVHCRPYRAPCVEHIVDEDDSLVRDVKGYLRRVYDGLVGELVEVIAIERDIEHAARQFPPLDLRDLRAEPRRDRTSTRCSVP